MPTTDSRLPDASRDTIRIESQGRQCELGRFLTEEERQQVALRLRRMAGGMNDSPQP